MARFRVTTENLWFCEVWPRDGYGLIRNATGEYSDDGAFMFLDRFRVTEILEEVSRIFEYFGFGTLACLHWKLLYYSALFFRTDFTVACVFQKHSTSTIRLPRLEFGRRISRLWKFRVVNFNFGACTAIVRGTHLSFFLNSLGLFPKDPYCLSPSSPHSPSLTSLSFGFSTLSRHPTTAGAPPPPSNLPNQ